MGYVFQNTIQIDDENPEATVVKYFQQLLLAFLWLLQNLSRISDPDNFSESSDTQRFPLEDVTILVVFARRIKFRDDKEHFDPGLSRLTPNYSGFMEESYWVDRD